MISKAKSIIIEIFVPKIASANLCKSIHDIINYFISICHFEFRKCEEEGKKITKI